eukprot:CAMPEP_0113943252 /NCGR_PEP_ID=MMETSP1339-20121228/22154_1 /TAXON_ID=94617 /ORGANISM="Fibrocapsa japonica" /LENGTH=164 /DNA_ID=CAMNT_0000948075 /DNA_START=297 /DNA_END=794 /DNA_ORIENTATION=+ /assembly_acc=CAM_ASM_000762
MTADARVVVQRLRYEAAEYRFKHGYDVPVHVLARRLADLSQVYTQHAGIRAMAATTILAGVDDEKGPMLFRIDPAGHYLPFKATSAGAKEQEAMNWLEKKVVEMPQMNQDQTIRTAIMCLQSVLSADFKSSEIEVAVLHGTGSFTKLSEQEIESQLNIINEEDA